MKLLYDLLRFRKASKLKNGNSEGNEAELQRCLHATLVYCIRTCNTKYIIIRTNIRSSDGIDRESDARLQFRVTANAFTSFFFRRYSRISMVREQTHAPLTKRALRVAPLLSTSSEKCSSQRALSLIKQMATVEKFMSQSKTRNPCSDSVLDSVPYSVALSSATWISHWQSLLFTLFLLILVTWSRAETIGIENRWKSLETKIFLVSGCLTVSSVKNPKANGTCYRWKGQDRGRRETIILEINSVQELDRFSGTKGIEQVCVAVDHKVHKIRKCNFHGCSSKQSLVKYLRISGYSI